MSNYIIFDNLTDEFMSFRASQRARSPPRKQRIKEAIKNQYYENVRRMLSIAVADDTAVECSSCQGLLYWTILLPVGKSRFACQLCNETCCASCMSNVVLVCDIHNRLTSQMCIECSEYVERLRARVSPEPATEGFLRLTEAFIKILELYKEANSNLFQLQGYVRLFTIHKQLKEPLPDGTRDKAMSLLMSSTSQRKQISDIKNEITNYKLQEQGNISLLLGIRRSLFVLSTGILYKTIPRINEIVYSLTQLEQVV
ncbi:hypothetical protein BgAZ_404670 [Babesia gibsoni]|uniref:FYVE-type domain-containing protein n=1 Tax=Babesia gibsoni TaxID=33632 RepID=A0AAD8LQD2_BABGI|nr:hypothetical protein BgAZ_404670 [Babesia gibsoni]